MTAVEIQPSKPAWHDQRVMIFHGKTDTHKKTSRLYETLTLSEVFALAKDVRSQQPKDYTDAMLPSSYNGPDGRFRDVQIAQGVFVAVCGDIDEHTPLAAIVDMLKSFMPADVACLVYSSSSATREKMKWRIVIPLEVSVNFPTWYRLTRALIDHAKACEVVLDEKLQSPNQPIFLPNRLPPAVRPATSHYEYKIEEGRGLTVDDIDLSEVPMPPAKAVTQPANPLAQGLRQAVNDDGPIRWFNARHPVREMLVECGYTHNGGDHWQSPLQVSGSFATQVLGERWRSLSGSDAAAGLGAESASGGTRTGDSFDLWVHYKHDGDRAAALAAVKTLMDDVQLQEARKVVNAMDDETLKSRWHTVVAGLSETGGVLLRAELGPRLKLLGISKGDASRMVAAAQRAKRREVPAGFQEVTLAPDKLAPAVEKVTAFLATSDDAFGRAGVLVRITESVPSTVRQVAKRHAMGEAYPPVLMVREHAEITLRLTLESRFKFYANGKTGPRLEAPSLDLLRGVLKMAPAQVRPLVSLVTWPFVGDDGVVVSRRGYDPATGLYLVLNEEPVVAKCPPAESLWWLREALLAEWSFTDDMHRDAAVALFLTAIQRPMLCGGDGAPMFALSSPVQSSGKTALLQLVSSLVHDRPLAAAAWPDTEAEMAKTLISYLREGLPMLLFDNLPAGLALKSEELAKLSSTAAYSGRLLNTNDTASMPTSTLVTFSGNNISMAGDFATRVVCIYLDTGLENPSARVFKRDLDSWAEQNRALFFAHSLNILKGKRGPSSRKGRFKTWNRVVLDPLLEAGAQSIEEMLKPTVDPEMDADAELLDTLGTFTAWDWFKAGDLAERAKKTIHSRERNEPMSPPPTDQQYEDAKALCSAMNAAAVRMNPKAIGEALRRMKNRPLHGKVVQTKADPKHGNCWRVMKVA